MPRRRSAMSWCLMNQTASSRLVSETPPRSKCAFYWKNSLASFRPGTTSKTSCGHFRRFEVRHPCLQRVTSTNCSAELHPTYLDPI